MTRGSWQEDGKTWQAPAAEARGTPLSIPPRRPVIRRFHKKPSVETDLKTLADAANDSAKREAAQWFFFLTITVTLAALVGSTTHRVLFLEDPVKVPLLSVELPLLGFYATAPAIYLVLHFYLLTQLQIMAGKVNAFLDAVVTETAGNAAERARALRRLDSFSVAQLMAADRFGERGAALRLMVTVTLVAAPLGLLLFFQLRFLPYHSERMTIWHQVLVGLDLALLWWLWPFAMDAGCPGRGMQKMARFGTGMVLVFSSLLAVVPGSRPEAILARLVAPTAAWKLETDGDPSRGSDALEAVRRVLFDGRTNEVTQRPTSWFSRRLVLRDEVFLTEPERKAWADTPETQRMALGRTRSLRGRDLRAAELNRADLRRTDLTAALLQGASFGEAQMQGAFLDGAQLQRASLDRAQMQGASLYKAQMHGASLGGAQLQGAFLDGAQLQGASLNGAQMQDAFLDAAQLQGASLFQAELQGASLGEAQLQGASLVEAQMQGASLDRAQMQGVLLDGAQLQGASLDGAQMQGASLDGAQLQGALLNGAQMQGASLVAAQLEAASLNASAIWRLHPANAEISYTQLLDLGMGAEPPCSPRAPMPGGCDRLWSQWAGDWLAAIPEGIRREQAGRQLAVLVADREPDEPLATSVWRDVPSPDIGQIADRLGTLACDAAAAPYVALGVLRQMDRRNLAEHKARLASRIAGADCAGAVGLTDSERAFLARIAAGGN